jgi:secondary thiamine-phosphate synthase enzyme
MTVKTDRISLRSRGNTDVVDITARLAEVVSRSGVGSGVATAFVIGSTAAITTIEFEPGLVHDIGVALDRLAPKDGKYEHQERYGDDNGHSHIRASMLGPSLAIPFVDKKLTLGTWQQVVFIDFDTRPRQREIVVQIIGE